jgi:hypothetical protein
VVQEALQKLCDDMAYHDKGIGRARAERDGIDPLAIWAFYFIDGRSKEAQAYKKTAAGATPPAPSATVTSDHTTKQKKPPDATPNAPERRAFWWAPGLPGTLDLFAKTLQRLGGEASSYDLTHEMFGRAPSKILHDTPDWKAWHKKFISQPGYGRYRLKQPKS